MAVLPAEIPTGLVTGQYYFVNADNVDAGTDPDLTVVTGIVKLTCQAKKPLRMPSKKATVIPMVFEGEFNNEGQLVPKGQTEIGIEVPASSSALFNPKDFTWLVEFELRDAATGFTINLESFPIYVTEGVENDLTLLAPIDFSPGTIVTQGPQGIPGPTGSQGPVGVGIPAGGSALQYVRKNAANTASEWATLLVTGLANNAKLDTDAPSTYPLGVSYFSTTANGFGINFGTVVTVRTGTQSRSVQTVTQSTGGGQWYRHESVDVWGPWYKVATDAVATGTVAGLMAAADKAKLDALKVTATAVKPVTDVPSSYPLGYSYFSISNDATWPVTYATISTIRAVSGRTAQTLISKVDSEVWTRTETDPADAWTGWKRQIDKAYVDTQLATKAPLDGTSRVPDANLPQRLQDADLNTKIDGRVTPLVNSAVPPAVSSYIANDPSVVNSAASAAQSTAGISLHWKPNTAYAAGTKVFSPDGDIVSAKVAFTSGATYSATNWNPSVQGGKITALEASRIPYRVTNTGDLDTMTTTEDVLFSGLSSVTNAPDTVLGKLQVRNAGGNVGQLWTSVLRTGGVQWYRYKSGAAAWTAWENASHRGPNITSSAWDLNTLRGTAVHSLATGSALNAPTTKAGTLWVVPSTGFSRQIFETWEDSSEIWTRRATSATAWGPWSRRVSWADIAANVSLSQPLRGTLTAPTLVETSKSGANIMSSLSRDRSKGWNMGGNTLKETNDDGATWTTVPGSAAALTGTNVELVRQMANGELLVAANFIAEERRGVLVTSGYGTPTVTWTRTLTPSYRMVKFAASWSVYTQGPVTLLAEYGPKTGMDWAGETVNANENARYVYLSMDYGKTWATIFDLNTYLVNAHGHTSTDVQHVHGVAWDQYWDRIWVTWGDNNGGSGSNGIAYSDDLGATWTTAHYHKGASSPFQIVGIQPLPKCILLFGDLSPDVLRIDRSAGKGAGAYTPVVAFDSTANGRHLCQGYWRADRPGDDAPTFAAFCAEMEVAPSFAVATLDGYTFVEIWRDSVDNPAGMGARSIVGPTLRGNVIINIDDTKVAGMRTEVKGKAPGY